MTKKEIAKTLINKGLLKSINKLYDLFTHTENKKPKLSGYSWDCVCCGKYDMRCDLEGRVQQSDEPEFINIKDKNF